MRGMGMAPKIAVPRSSMENGICHPGSAQVSPAPRSVREAEVHHVAVDDDVILALEPEFSRFTRAGFAVTRDVIVIGDRFSADEALLEIGMDDARRLRRAGAARDRPGARLFRAGGEIGDEIEE